MFASPMKENQKKNSHHYLVRLEISFFSCLNSGIMRSPSNLELACCRWWERKWKYFCIQLLNFSLNANFFAFKLEMSKSSWFPSCSTHIVASSWKFLMKSLVPTSFTHALYCSYICFSSHSKVLLLWKSIRLWSFGCWTAK